MVLVVSSDTATCYIWRSHRDGRNFVTLPLNSKRFKVAWLKCLATSWGLAVSAPLEDTRCALEGSITERGHEPRNVQVVVTPGLYDNGVLLQLRDDDGVFHEAN